MGVLKRGLNNEEKDRVITVSFVLLCVIIGMLVMILTITSVRFTGNFVRDSVNSRTFPGEDSTTTYTNLPSYINVGNLEIEVISMGNADIYLENQHVGVNYVKLKDLEAGEYEIKIIDYQGHESIVKKFVLPGRDNVYNHVIEEAETIITISTSPEGAIITENGI